MTSTSASTRADVTRPVGQNFVHRGCPPDDSAIAVVYGVGSPERPPHRLSLPVYGLRPGTTSSFSATAWDRRLHTISGNVSEGPSIGVVDREASSGRQRRGRPSSSCTRWTGRYKQSSAPRKTWQADVVIESSTNDMRVAFSSLLAGLVDFIGQNTKQRIIVEVEETGQGRYRRKTPTLPECGPTFPRESASGCAAHAAPAPGMPSSGMWSMQEGREALTWLGRLLGQKPRGTRDR